MKSLTVKTFTRDFFLHYVVFLFLCFLFDFMSSSPGPLQFPMLRGFLSIESISLIGYLSYCILFYHLFFKKILVHVKLWNLIIILVLLVAYFFLIDILFMNLLSALRHRFTHFTWFITSGISRFIIFTAYAVAYSFIRGFAWLRIQKLQIERESANATLKNLRSQIEPHFIFNSLNSVYALSMEEKAQKTSESIEELSSLFRYSLKDSSVIKVPVRDELEFIEKYIHLNKIRVQENSKIKVDATIFWDKKPAQIATMLIITFVENAFKYGISFKRNSFIDVSILIEDCKLQLVVRNSVASENTNPKNGFGLINTRKRLALLYNENYSLEEKHDENIHEVKLSLNLI